METLGAYRFELDPSNRQRTQLSRAAGLSRIVWNWGLAARQEHYQCVVKPARERGEKTHGLTKFDQINAWNAAKSEVAPWASEFSSRIPQYALEALNEAYAAWFRALRNKQRGGAPRFKARGKCRQGFRLRGAIRVEERAVTLPRLGQLRIKGSTRNVSGAIRYATVSERAGRWFVSLTVLREQPQMATVSTEIVGIDIGLRNSITLSTGEVIQSPRALKTSLAKLRRGQKAVARSQRNSRRRAKKVARVSTIHARVANVRSNWLHGVSDALTRRFAVIGHETLAVKNLSTRKHHNGRAWADLGAGELFRQLAYKAAWREVQLVAADRFYPSSQLCSSCGWRNHNLTLDDRIFVCSICGLALDRDLNAALNLKPVAVMPTETLNARGGNISPGLTWQIPVKREPSFIQAVV